MLIGPHSTAARARGVPAKIQANPRNYIAQPTLSLSRAPCFIDGRIEPRHVDLRPYVLYGERRHDRAGRPDARRAAQGIARRQLVAGRRQQGHLGAGGLNRHAAVTRRRLALLDRRYLERAEHTVRLIDVRLDLGLDRRPDADGWDFARLCAAVKCDVSDRRADAIPAALVDALVFDAANRGLGAGLRHRRARQRAAGARGDQLRHVGAAQRAVPAAEAGAQRRHAGRSRPHYLVAAGHRRRAPLRGRHRRDDGARRGLAVPAGRALHRARRGDRGAGRSALPGDTPRLPANHVEWVGLLRSCAAFEAYCRYYTADVRPDRVAEFLLLNAEFPRSVRFAAARVEIGAARDRAADRARRRRTRRAARRPAARVARLRPGRRDPRRRSARLPRGHRPLLRADPRRGSPELHRVSDRIRAAGVRASPCITRFATSPSSATRRRSARASWKCGCSRAARAPQRCVRFGLSTTPASRVMMYEDRDGNTVHHFNIPGRHSRLIVTAEALIEMGAHPPLPDSLLPGAWERLDALTARGEFWELLQSQPLRPADAAARRAAARAGARARAGSARDAAAAERRDLRALRVQPADARASTRRSTKRSARGGRLPGLRAHHDRAGAQPRRPVPLRQRLSLPAAAIAASARPTARRTPGSRRCCRTSAGSASIRRTICLPTSGTSASRSAATTPTCRRRAACSRARARCAASWASP